MDLSSMTVKVDVSPAVKELVEAVAEARAKEIESRLDSIELMLRNVAKQVADTNRLQGA